MVSKVSQKVFACYIYWFSRILLLSHSWNFLQSDEDSTTHRRLRYTTMWNVNVGFSYAERCTIYRTPRSLDWF